MISSNSNLLIRFFILLFSVVFIHISHKHIVEAKSSKIGKYIIISIRLGNIVTMNMKRMFKEHFHYC